MMKIKNLVAAMSMVLATGSYAATTASGTLGVNAGSTGAVDVKLTVPQLIQLSGLTDIIMSSWNGTDSASTGTIDFCVYLNTGNTYEVTATSSFPDTDGTTFQLSGSGGTIDYALTYSDLTTTNVTLASGTITTSDFAGSNVGRNCGGGTNASLDVTIANTDMNAVTAGSYSDTMTLLVTPE